MALNMPLLFSRVRAAPFGGKLTQPQVDGLTTILDYAAQRMPPDPRWLAYMLATTFHETAATMQPIEEYGRGAGRPYAASGCWGRGYVQLTWPYNYALWTKRLGVDLVRKPALALTPAVALPVLFDGMATGCRPRPPLRSTKVLALTLPTAYTLPPGRSGLWLPTLYASCVVVRHSATR